MTSHRTILYYSAVPSENDAAALAPLAAALRGVAPAGEATRVRGRASLAGIALALRALRALCARVVRAEELVFAPGAKPRFPGGPDFSISHSDEWVGVAATASGAIGFDIEGERADRLALRFVCDETELASIRDCGATAMWVAKEAALKAWGLGILAAPRVRIRGNTAALDARRLTLHPVTALAGARACIATAGALETLEQQYVPPAALL
jgi:4'-phosphopantetheinyl transferase EntD